MNPTDHRNRPAEPKSFASWTERAARHAASFPARMEARSVERRDTPQQPVL